MRRRVDPLIVCSCLSRTQRGYISFNVTRTRTPTVIQQPARAGKPVWIVLSSFRRVQFEVKTGLTTYDPLTKKCACGVAAPAFQQRAGPNPQVSCSAVDVLADDVYYRTSRCLWPQLYTEKKLHTLDTY